MRLLDTTTIELHEFFGSNIPYYAILSHRWEDDEVTFQDLQNGRGTSMKGYQKIQGCCRKAARDGWRYAWVDSCCIDKSSSAELSEAINSMFQWYKESQVCYVFLADVPAGLTIKQHHKKRSRFRRSQWWTRGWTLQELLAPTKLLFYDSGWEEIGTKRYLQGLIYSVTGIDDMQNFMKASVARKMSWASKRKTTRIEDQAYCLLGIFDVNMPPLYGEGNKAFQRLQLEILRTSDDESIFAWDPWDMSDGEPPAYTSLRLLALSPSAFGRCGNIMQSTSRSAYDPERPPFSTTNKGFRMELILQPCPPIDTFEAPLNCEQDSRTVVLRLRKVEDSVSHFHRECAVIRNCNKTFEKPVRTTLFIYPNDLVQPDESSGQARPICFETKNDSLLTHGYNELGILTIPMPSSSWINLLQMASSTYLQDQMNEDDFCRFEFEHNHDASMLLFGDGSKDTFVVILKRDRRATNDIILDICIPRDKQRRENFHADLKRKLHGKFGSDRISRRMKSGRTVSIVLRKMNLPGGSLLYELDIDIDAEGKLRWPDLSDLKKFE